MDEAPADKTTASFLFYHGPHGGEILFYKYETPNCAPLGKQDLTR